MAYPHLFEPIDVGPITIPNRIVRTAHGTMLTGERLIAYHEARAAGGVGMSTLEATGVHANAPSVTPLYSDDVIPIYRELMARIRPHGMKMFQQIYHPGSATRPKKAATQVSSSAIPNPMVGGIPVEMDHSMIAEMVDAFAAATRRCRDGGLDGVDLHASSGYLIEQFLSPANNVRTDEYGGSLENRMRFLMEILQAIRAEVGDDYCVGIRLPNEEYIPGGMTPQDVAEVAKLVEPYVDYVSLHMGSYWRFHKLLSPMDDPLGSEMPVNEVITQVVDEADDRRGPHHDARPRRAHRGERRRRHGLDGARPDRRPGAREQGARRRGAPDPAVHRLQLRVRRQPHVDGHALVRRQRGRRGGDDGQLRAVSGRGAQAGARRREVVRAGSRPLGRQPCAATRCTSTRPPVASGVRWRSRRAPHTGRTSGPSPSG